MPQCLIKTAKLHKKLVFTPSVQGQRNMTHFRALRLALLGVASLFRGVLPVLISDSGSSPSSGCTPRKALGGKQDFYKYFTFSVIQTIKTIFNTQRRKLVCLFLTKMINHRHEVLSIQNKREPRHNFRYKQMYLVALSLSYAVNLGLSGLCDDRGETCSSSF